MHITKLFLRCSLPTVVLTGDSGAGARNVLRYSCLWPPPDPHLVAWPHRWQHSWNARTTHSWDSVPPLPLPQLQEQQGPSPHSLPPPHVYTNADLDKHRPQRFPPEEDVGPGGLACFLHRGPIGCGPALSRPTVWKKSATPAECSHLSCTWAQGCAGTNDWYLLAPSPGTLWNEQGPPENGLGVEVSFFLFSLP